MAEVGSAYLQIIPTTKGIGKTLSAELSGSIANVSKASSKSLVSSLGGSLARVGKIGVGAFAAVGTAVTGIALKGGITRALNIEQAQHAFKELGFDAQKAMSIANDAVKGTAFGLDQAAQLTAQLGTSGVAMGDDMTTALKSVAGAAAMSGSSYDELGAIWAKAAAKGKVQGDTLAQLAEHGVNAASALSKHLGVSMEEVYDLASKGKISFNDFSDAMYGAFGDAAFAANETFSGALANTRAALSRLTAPFATTAFESLRKILVALIPVVDTIGVALGPAQEKFAEFSGALSENIASKLESFSAAIENAGGIIPLFTGAIDNLKAKLLELLQSGLGTASDTFATLATKVPILQAPLNALSDAFSTLKDTIGAAIPDVQAKIDSLHESFSNIGSVSEGLNKAFSGIKDMFAQLGSNLVSFASPFIVAISGLFGPQLLGLLSRPLASIEGGLGGIFARLGSSVVGSLAGGVTASGALTSVLGIITRLLNPIGLVVGAFASMMATSDSFRTSVLSVGSAIVSGIMPAITTLGQTLMDVGSTILPVIMDVINQLTPVFADVGLLIGEIIAAIAPLISQIVTQLAPVITQIVAAIGNFVSAVAPLVVAVIQAILSIIRTIIPVLQPILATIITVISTVIAVIVNIATVVANVISTIIAVVQPIIVFILGVVTTVIGVVTTILSAIANIVSAVVGLVGSVISNVSGLIATIVSKVAGFVGNITGKISGLVNNIVAKVGNVISTVKSRVQAGINNVVSFIQAIPGKIIGIFSNAGSLLANVGSQIIDGLVNGIKGAFGRVQDALGGLTSLLPSWKGPESLDKVLLTPNGKLIISGFINGLKEQFPEVKRTLQTMTGELGTYFGSNEMSFAYDGLAAYPSSQFSPQSAQTNIYINDAIINSDEQILTLFNNFMSEVARKGHM